MTTTRVMQRSLAMTLLVGGLAALGCERTLPGPADCQRVAAISLGLSNREQLRIPHVKQRFDRIVVDCLTTPYDRQLVRCLEETGRSRQCAAAFRSRHLESHGGEPRRRFSP